MNNKLNSAQKWTIIFLGIITANTCILAGTVLTIIAFYGAVIATIIKMLTGIKIGQ
jgi:hypothetical protein